MRKRMIFHYPMPLSPDGISGSQVRSFSMYKAFESIGYEVESVTGYAQARRQAIKRVKRLVSEGYTFDFVYTESSTLPIFLAESHHIPTHPFLDFCFLDWLHRQAIPIGLFYRDLHWRFEHYKSSVIWYKRFLTIPMFWAEWFLYKKVVDYLFLPSKKMKSYIPTFFYDEKVEELFPGYNMEVTHEHYVPFGKSSGVIQLFYVGGVTPPLYDLTPLFDAISLLRDIHLTICCRKWEWENVASYYKSIDRDKVQIVHASGHELVKYYASADFFLLFWQRNLYLDFAMPVKIFESLGFGVPIITNSGTESARFVEQEQIGWVVETQNELASLLSYLRDSPALVMQRREHIRTVRQRHTWDERAKMVARILSGNALD